MGIEWEERRTRLCRNCCEPMDVRAVICPHCRRRTDRAEPQHAGVKFVILGLLLLTLPLWFRVCLNLGELAGGMGGKQLASGTAQAGKAAQAQPLQKAQGVHPGSPMKAR